MQPKQLKSNNRYINYFNKIILSKLGLKIDFNINEDDIYPIGIKEHDKKLIELLRPISMSSNIRFYELINSVNYIIRNKIEGDLIECGVWKGANIILMQKLLEINKISNKRVYGFDTFDGMSEPSEYDYDLIGNNALDLMKKTKKKEGRGIWAYSTLETVKKNISDLVEFEQNIHLIQGKVEDTLPNNKKLPKKISLLRLDTDFYESTKIELEILYPLLAKGGVLIIDDYGHFQGAKKAVDDYFAKQKIWLKYVDYTCRLYIKE